MKFPDRRWSLFVRSVETLPTECVSVEGRTGVGTDRGMLQRVADGEVEYREANTYLLKR